MASRSRKCTRTEDVVSNPDIDAETEATLREIEEGGMQAQIKYIDKRYTDKGQVYYAETVEEDIPEQVNWWNKFAICLVRHLDSSGKYVKRICLQINSQHLKDLLKTTIDQYPGVSFQTKDITIQKPYHVLFHYRHELEAAGKDFEGEAAEHLKLLIDFINEEFAETMEESNNLVEQGLINYSHLWTIFRPGVMVYAPAFGQPRAFKLQSYVYQSGELPGLALMLEYTDFDGEDFGTRTTSRLLPSFGGAKKINDLTAYPISWHQDPHGTKKQLLERGRRWEAFAGMHFNIYNGVALEHTPRGISRYSVEGRVAVDTKTYHRLNADFAFIVTAFESNESKANKRRRILNDDSDDEGDGNEETLDLVPQTQLKFDPLDDNACILANATVRGFSFAEKKWCDFFVDKLSSPDWNAKCFEQLVLPSAQKDLVRALVATHTKQRDGFDDIVKGKGKGLIMVLHGPPGVGKTSTAETVAEYCQRPLYMVSSGDLGTDTSTLDARLSRILDMASTWKAVLLIDEADVFLERRSLHDMERNSLVSIFLRVLEYYEGILFLTSNRVSTFDDAFKSRIHVPLKYDDLTVESRKQIWKNFLVRQEGVFVDEAGLAALAQANINGRQIKNVIRTAKSLAQFHGEQLDQKKLQQIITIQEEFEAELDLRKDLSNGVNGYQEVNGH
ncbi:P-loop containing nucleoside triphosphate hydrolase protein [Teratosphaeria destructans]|uniref:P-loop containing nucleoside triphosphate hydrolase protein n=1 Tax=Teratosphaeria destructans TaxID=418781 RepID=A0A9W7SHS0_9PEZI|nr:P-loop containing nucleoside triphosphate hydrolase protein [Teratosphaeria destructans]